MPIICHIKIIQNRLLSLLLLLLLLSVKKSKNEECHWMRAEPKHIDHRTIAVKINYMEKPSQRAIKQEKLTTLIFMHAKKKIQSLWWELFVVITNVFNCVCRWTTTNHKWGFFDDVTMKYDEEIKMKDDATFAVIISCNYY